MPDPQQAGSIVFLRAYEALHSPIGCRQYTQTPSIEVHLSRAMCIRENKLAAAYL